MPPLITPGVVRIFSDHVRDLAMAAAKEVARAANKEMAAEFVEELAKEIMQQIVKELVKRGCGRKEEEQEEQVEELKVHQEDIDEIIYKILHGDCAFEPPVGELKDQHQLALPDAMGEKDESELPPRILQDDRAQKLYKEIELLQKKWISLTLAQATETTPKSKWNWKPIVIVTIVVIILVGGAAYLLHRRRGGSGTGNGGGGAGMDGRGAAALGQEHQNHAAVDQAVQPPGPVGLQILLCSFKLPSGPLVWRRIVSIDGLVPAARGTCDVAAPHPVPITLPVGTAIIAEAFEEIIADATVEEFTKLQKDTEEEVKEASRGACRQKDMKSEVESAVSCLEDGFQELIISLLSHSKEENVIVDEEVLKPCKSVHLPLVAGQVGNALCV